MQPHFQLVLVQLVVLHFLCQQILYVIELLMVTFTREQGELIHRQHSEGPHYLKITLVFFVWFFFLGRLGVIF